MPFDPRPIIALCTVAAAATASAQQGPAVRPLGPVVARTTEPLIAVNGVRHLPGGRVLVNDVRQRRVLLFDSTMSRATVVADSTSATGNAYGGQFGGLIAYRGDSTLFVDPMTMSMLVIDPQGKIGRVMSVPRTQDAAALAGLLGVPAFDGSGRLVYRGNNRVPFRRPANADPGAPPQMPEQPDSAPVVRVDLATRVLDTVGFIRVPKLRMSVTQEGNGRFSMTSEINPLPLVDDWVVLADGSVAFVRGRDYHVDFVGPDGSRRSAPKMPFDWRRLSDEDKVAFIDSVKAARERMRASGAQQAGQMIVSSGGPPPGGAPAMGATEQRQMIVMGAPPPGDAGGPRSAAVGAAAAGMQAVQPTFVAPSELPDYQPPFFANSVRADADGNLWIRTTPTRAIPGGPIYDVVNGRGELVDRVQLPAGRTIVGFGTGGTVYLSAREGTTTVLERARVR